MKYRAENDLSLFEFHDSRFSFVSFDGTDLTISADFLNIHKCTEQNPSDYDMEIECAQITFRNFHSPSYEPGKAWKTGADGKEHPVGPRVVFSGQEAMDKILKELQNQITVYEFGKTDDGSYYIDGSGIEPFFTMTLCFDNTEIMWDAYKKKAWYEAHKQYQHTIKLDTPNGECDAELHIIYHTEDVYFKAKKEKAPVISAGITYQNQEFWGYSHTDTWELAFADLQRQLPSGVFLKCCMTCRHGNQCPYGGDDVYCTKDHLITSKDDVCTLFDQMAVNPRQIEARHRQYGDFCESYQTQGKGFYTYNDYAYFLKKATKDL